MKQEKKICVQKTMQQEKLFNQTSARFIIVNDSLY